MSSVASPFGLRPAWSPQGIVRPALGTIASGYATAIFLFSPVAIDVNGFVTAAAPAARAIGTFLGVEFDNPSTGRRQVQNQWVASTVANNIVAWYTFDPSIVYEIQGNAPVPLSGMGQQYNWSALAGNATTGLSSVSLNVASAAANAGLRVIGCNPGPDNVFGDAFTIVQVQISQHQYVADQASV